MHLNPLSGAQCYNQIKTKPPGMWRLLIGVFTLRRKVIGICSQDPLTIVYLIILDHLPLTEAFCLTRKRVPNHLKAGLCVLLVSDNAALSFTEWGPSKSTQKGTQTALNLHPEKKSPDLNQNAVRHRDGIQDLRENCLSE